jgi:dTDP-4-amino-4,6-dideoxygalactose transaminase
MILTKTAVRRETYMQPSFFYASAREGMLDFLTNVLQPSEGVLLPAYIGWSRNEGSGVLDPILDSGARTCFYNLNSDLSVDMANLEQKLLTGSFRVLVVIHYFGRTEIQLAAIRELADRHGVLLLEDLAHAFFSALGAGDAGNVGHVSLYSLHKMFPFAQGGLIRYLDTALVRGQKSTFSEVAEQLFSYDFSAISAARRRNFVALTELLEAVPEIGSRFQLMWPVLSDHDVPQTLPVRIIGDGRDNIYSNMNREGFGMVSLYHTLVPQVREDFDKLNLLSRQIINFPVHQDVELRTLPSMVASFRRYLNSSRS